MKKLIPFMKCFILVLICLFANKRLLAQSPRTITPMHKFLQKNADSTIIIEYDYSWIHTPEYFILSKKEDTISIYTYKILPSIDNRIILPHNIGYNIHKRNKLDIYNTPVDINIYFNPKYIDGDSLNKFWQNVKLLKPWQIRDDSKDGKACKEFTEDKYISDLGGISLFLITKNEIKTLYFYGPKYFEEKVCPSRKGRKSILAIEQLFLKYFKS